MERQTVPLFCEVFPITDELLNDSQFGSLIRAYADHARYGTDYAGDDTAVAMAFRFMASQLSRYDKKAEEISKKRQEAAKKKQEANKEQTIANDSKTVQTDTNVSKSEQTPANDGIQSISNPYPIQSNPVQSISNINNNSARATAKEKTDAEFERFWSAYPKKVGKGAALKAYQKARKPADVLIAAVEDQKQSEQWTTEGGRYIPNPATWLTQERWNDSLKRASGYQTTGTWTGGSEERAAIEKLRSVKL